MSIHDNLTAESARALTQDAVLFRALCRELSGSLADAAEKGYSHLLVRFPFRSGTLNVPPEHRGQLTNRGLLAAVQGAEGISSAHTRAMAHALALGYGIRATVEADPAARRHVPAPTMTSWVLDWGLAQDATLDYGDTAYLPTARALLLLHEEHLKKGKVLSELKAKIAAAAIRGEAAVSLNTHIETREVLQSLTDSLLVRGFSAQASSEPGECGVLEISW